MFVVRSKTINFFKTLHYSCSSHERPEDFLKGEEKYKDKLNQFSLCCQEQKGEHDTAIATTVGDLHVH